MDTAEKFLSDARIVYSNVPDERQSIMLRVKYIQQRHGGTDFNSRACILYELWNKSGKVLLSVLRTVEEITSFTICHSGLYGKIMMVSANRRTCLYVLGLNSSSGSGVAASGQESLNSSLGSRVAASCQEGLNCSSGSGVAASGQE